MAKIVLKSYDEINKSRKKSRRILVLLSIPFIVSIGLFSMKAFSMYVSAEQTISVYKKGDFVKSIETAKEQKVNNFFEPWLAYYNLGTSYAAQKNYDQSETELVHALEIVGNNLNQCYIRSNLSIVYEAQGDIFTQNGDSAKAKQRYALVKKVISEAPEECFPPSSGGKGSEKSESSKAGKQMDETEKRVKGKEDKASGKTDPATTSDPASGDEQDDTRKIQEQIDQSNTDRTSKENSERGNAPEKIPAPKPW